MDRVRGKRVEVNLRKLYPKKKDPCIPTVIELLKPYVYRK